MANNKFDSKSFNAEAFGKYVERIPATKRNELIKSGVLKNSVVISDAFSSQSGAYYARLPLFGRLGGSALNYDGQTDITAGKTNSYERGVIVVGRANAWGEMDFSYDITSGTDFMDNVAEQISEYWAEVDQNTILKILEGIFKMTGKENLEFVNKHTYDISGGENNTVDATSLNIAIQNACGDNKSKFSIAIMNSAVATNLENLQVLNYFKYNDEKGMQRDISLGAWNGRVVFIDDSMPKEYVKDGDYTKYTTYLLGGGAFDYANIGAKVPFEMSRDPKTKGGEDTLYSRQRKAFAPFGISYEKVNQESLSPTDEELADGSNWCLVKDNEGGFIDHKAIPIARIISRG